MRIVFANNYVYPRGGSERVMLDEMQQLRLEGNEVALFGRTDHGLGADLPNSDLFPQVVDFTQRNGLNKLKAARDVIYNRDTSRRFHAFCGRVKPNIMHAHNIYAGLTTSVLDACKAKGVPCVMTLHDYKLACPSYLMLNGGQICERCVGGCFARCFLTACHKDSRAASLVSSVEAYFNEWFGKYLQAEYLIAPSRFLLYQMVAHGIPADKLLCIPNGLDPKRFEPSYDDGGYILYVGRISREKGISTLLGALVGTGVTLRIVGEGPEKEKLSKTLDLQNADHVSFVGYKQGEGLRDLMRGAMFVVVPSEWYENASMSVLESMAYGKAVIASRIGGIPDQVSNEETGLLFEPGNVRQLHDAILALASDKARRVAMGKAGRARLESHFSLARHCQALLKVYRAAIRKEPVSQSGLD